MNYLDYYKKVYKKVHDNGNGSLKMSSEETENGFKCFVEIHNINNGVKTYSQTIGQDKNELKACKEALRLMYDILYSS